MNAGLAPVSRLKSLSGAGLVLVWCWFGAGLVLVWCWFGAGLVLVWCWFAAGLLLVCCWFGAGFVLVWSLQQFLYTILFYILFYFTNLMVIWHLTGVKQAPTRHQSLCRFDAKIALNQRQIGAKPSPDRRLRCETSAPNLRQTGNHGVRPVPIRRSDSLYFPSEVFKLILQSITL